jgi:hypothetical protein
MSKLRLLPPVRMVPAAGELNTPNWAAFVPSMVILLRVRVVTPLFWTVIDFTPALSNAMVLMPSESVLPLSETLICVAVVVVRTAKTG